MVIGLMVIAGMASRHNVSNFSRSTQSNRDEVILNQLALAIAAISALIAKGPQRLDPKALGPLALCVTAPFLLLDTVSQLGAAIATGAGLVAKEIGEFFTAMNTRGRDRIALSWSLENAVLVHFTHIPIGLVAVRASCRSNAFFRKRDYLSADFAGDRNNGRLVSIAFLAALFSRPRAWISVIECPSAIFAYPCDRLPGGNRVWDTLRTAMPVGTAHSRVYARETSPTSDANGFNQITFAVSHKLSPFGAI
jgi:hypothetical protein